MSHDIRIYEIDEDYGECSLISSNFYESNPFVENQTSVEVLGFLNSEKDLLLISDKDQYQISIYQVNQNKIICQTEYVNVIDYYSSEN